MRMKVICGDEECREEFYVESKEHIWVCPNCSREIENRNYPFLTAKLMQARIDREKADWKVRLEELIGEVEREVSERSSDAEVPFIDDYREKISQDLDNSNYLELHDELLERARLFILDLEK